MHQTDLNERDAQLCFVWARMRTIDEQHDKSRTKMTHLSFEDFLEALCRCSVCKAWPTREEMEAAESANAGVHLLNLQRDDPVAYDKLGLVYRRWRNFSVGDSCEL